MSIFVALYFKSYYITLLLASRPLESRGLKIIKISS